VGKLKTKNPPCFLAGSKTGRFLSVITYITGLVWSGLVWSGLVWSGLVWSGLVWSGLARYMPNEYIFTLLFIIFYHIPNFIA